MQSSLTFSETWEYASGGVTTDLPIPTSIAGYQVIKCLGEGAGSKIYTVRHPATSQVFALKHVVVTKEKELRFAEQLLNEYEVGKQIQHPLIRRVYEAKVHRTLLRKITEASLIMELVDGVPLDRIRSLNLVTTAAIFSKVAAALHQLHLKNFIHCDLKPNNIMVDANCEVKLIDLGQACPVMTAKQRIQGTPDFISPEQVKCEPVTVKTDVFNLGATLYQMIAGKSLPTLFSVGKKENSFLLDGMIPVPHEVNPAVPENFSQFVMDCVKSNPAKRPADMLEVSRRLELISLGMARNAKVIRTDC